MVHGSESSVYMATLDDAMLVPPQAQKAWQLSPLTPGVALPVSPPWGFYSVPWHRHFMETELHSSQQVQRHRLLLSA